MSDPNAQRRSAYLKSLSADKQKAANSTWSFVHAEIEKRAADRRPKPKNFEIMHEIFVSRDAYIDALMEGKTPPDQTGR